MGYKDPSKLKAYRIEHYKKNKETIKAAVALYRANISTRAIAMLVASTIDEPHIWHLYCNRKKAGAAKYPYSDDFTDEKMFEIMKKGCVYCGDLATTIDRIDSSLAHTLDNCVGACVSCNKSKGNGDLDTFLRKAYYRSRGEYLDDHGDIWSDNSKKPQFIQAKKKSEKQLRQFTLTQSDWNILIAGDCAYCGRQRPNKKWNGVDRIIPSDGYTPDNTTTCCDDCNIDKGENSVEETVVRNNNIANRLEFGEIKLSGYEKNLRNKGANPKSKKVCANGKVYMNRAEASRMIGKGDWYVQNCLFYKRHIDNIFEISEEFYEDCKETDMYITKTMYEIFEQTRDVKE